jgi:Spy/CpxP family protein refolding chaperone
VQQGVAFLAFGVLIMLAVPGVAQRGYAPYAGQEQRAIKALSEEDIQALLNGQGMGLAKAAELNQYPGPRHVLDAATMLQLSESQRIATQQIYDRMHQEAARLGRLLIAKERELDGLFASNDIDTPTLQHLVRAIAQLQGELRLTHLQAHVDLKQILSTEQVARYDAWRGYNVQGLADVPGAHQHGQH